MKKLWIVLLSLGLIMALTMPAFAATAQFSGSYFAQGIYENNRGLSDPGNTSLSAVIQRLRVDTVIPVAEGLKLTTQFHALEKVWGTTRSTVAPNTSSMTPSYEMENIKFTFAYVTFAVPFGQFDVGYQRQSVWGTTFGDNGERDYGGRVKYTYATGPWTFLALWDQVEGGKTLTNLTTRVDQSNEKYSLAFINKGIQNVDYGVLYQFWRVSSASTSTPATSYISKYHVLEPYFKGKFGNVYAEGEFDYVTGKANQYDDNSANQDIDRVGWSLYLMANVDLAPFYVGGQIIYITGNDPGTATKNEQGIAPGMDFAPCLILLNPDLARFIGTQGMLAGYQLGNDGTTIANGLKLGQLFVGVKPTPKLDLKASFTYADADQKTATNSVDTKYGNEFDISATYKIYDNLSYLVGFGYLWAGDYFKGTAAGNTVGNDYILTHKLTLVF